MFGKLRRKALLLAGLASAVLSLAAPQARAIITYTDQSQVLFSSMVVQSVIPKAGGYRMYLSSGGHRILSATSADQVTWTLEAGIRLSTAASADLDSSSITSCGVYVSSNSADPLRMYYVGISSVGYYRILSATSTDGLTWNKTSSGTLAVASGLGYLDSPRPFGLGSSGMRLFYVADGTGGNSSANYQVYSASSTDGGLTLSTEGARLSGTQAFHVSVSTLTDGRTRLYYSAPLSGQTTVSQVLSAVSPASDGLTFTAESGVRFSTSSAAASLSYPLVVRSTENHRWRMFWAYTPGGSTIPVATHSLATTPVILTVTPGTTLKTVTSLGVSVTGEVFAPAPALTYYQGSTTMTATGVASSDDLNLTGTVNPFNRALGMWHAVVTNPDGAFAIKLNALDIDIPGGTVSITDNLFRPLRGGRSTISTVIYEAGNVTMKLYTTDGQLVATLWDGPMADGGEVTTWDGKTGLGNTVASGVYLLSVRGPKLDTLQKIVVIK